MGQAGVWGEPPERAPPEPEFDFGIDAAVDPDFDAEEETTFDIDIQT